MNLMFMYNRKKVGLQILIAKKLNIKSMEDLWRVQRRETSAIHMLREGGEGGRRI